MSFICWSFITWFPSEWQHHLCADLYLLLLKRGRCSWDNKQNPNKNKRAQTFTHALLIESSETRSPGEKTTTTKNQNKHWGHQGRINKQEHWVIALDTLGLVEDSFYNLNCVEGHCFRGHSRSARGSVKQCSFHWIFADKKSMLRESSGKCKNTLIYTYYRVFFSCDIFHRVLDCARHCICMLRHSDLLLMLFMKPKYCVNLSVTASGIFWDVSHRTPL